MDAFKLKAKITNYLKKNPLDFIIGFCVVGILLLFFLTQNQKTSYVKPKSFKLPKSLNKTELYKSKIEAFKQEKKRKSTYRYTSRPTFPGAKGANEEHYPTTTTTTTTQRKPFSNLAPTHKEPLKEKPSGPQRSLPYAKVPKFKKQKLPHGAKTSCPTKEELEKLKKDELRKKFEALEKKQKSQSKEKEIIRAQINHNQLIANGKEIRFHLLEEITIDGIIIPAYSTLYGKANFSSHRIEVSFSSLVYNNQLLPFKRTLYDFDGWKGIAVDSNEELINRDDTLKKEGLNLDEHIEPIKNSKYLSKGISAIKKIVSKKNKPTLIELIDGHQVLLKKKSN